MMIKNWRVATIFVFFQYFLFFTRWFYQILEVLKPFYSSQTSGRLEVWLIVKFVFVVYMIITWYYLFTRARSAWVCSFNSTWHILIVPMVLLVFPWGVLYLCFGARQITSNVLCILTIKGICGLLSSWLHVAIDRIYVYSVFGCWWSWGVFTCAVQLVVGYGAWWGVGAGAVVMSFRLYYAHFFVC